MFGPFRQVARIAAAALLVSATPASAGTIYDLNATTLFPGSINSFSIRFDDTSGDGLLQLGEITSFSGVNFNSLTYPTVSCVPNTTFSTGVCGQNEWGFVRSGGALGVTTNTWTYALNPVSAVPLPPALLLFASALGLIGLARWWKTRRTPVVLFVA